MRSFFDFVRSPKFPYLCVFLAAVILRGIPELIVPMYPVGYETVTWYAPVMMTFYGRSLIDVVAGTFRGGPVFYVLMWLVANVSGAHAFVILKVAGPLLYGGLSLSFLFFLKRGLKLDGKMAFVATLMLVFQVAALRISWDRFRIVLGLVFLFATLTALKSGYKHKWWFVGVFAVLTVLSREYIGFVLFVTVLGFAILGKRNRLRSLVALAPALTILGVIVYPARIWCNYIVEGAPPSISGTYFGVVQDVFSIFAVCYIPLLPFVVKGFRRDRLLDPMLGWLLLGSFSVIVSPWFAVPGYQRWLVLLVFPFSIYAVKGFRRFNLFSERRIKRLTAVVLIFMVIGVGYSTGAFSTVLLSNSWVPVNLVQSSIAWSQIDDVKEVLRWLDENAVTNSSVLAEERFYGWTLVYLKRANNDVKVTAYSANSPPTHALEEAIDDGFSWIYLIWYTNSSIEDFEVLHSNNTVAIFRYVP